MSNTITNLTIGLNENWDMYIGTDGNIAMLTGVDALKQDCQSALSSQLREMIYDYDNGMPTMDAVFDQVNLPKYVSKGIQMLSAIQGVISIKSFTANVINGEMNYSVDILSIYSDSIVNVRPGI